VLEYSATDPESLRALFVAHPRQIAAVILAPEMVLPFDPATFHELLRIARAHDAVFIMDEVKTGLRIFPGSVCERIQLVPDIITVSKALGNGWAIALTAGRRDVMAAGAGLHYSATFHGDTAAMAAALQTIEIVEREDVRQRVERLGQRLIEGLNSSVEKLGIPATAYGEPLSAMPFFRFTHPDAERNAALTRWFYREVLARGQLLHPRHLWFLSGAHSEADVEQTLHDCQGALCDTLSIVSL
jgi:glutamate-1-semialdehyde 2,1-aminomutase